MGIISSMHALYNFFLSLDLILAILVIVVVALQKSSNEGFGSKSVNPFSESVVPSVTPGIIKITRFLIGALIISCVMTLYCNKAKIQQSKASVVDQTEDEVPLD